MVFPAAAGSRRAAAAESGFVLLSVLILVAMMMLALSIAAPRVADDIRRDRENEYYHRGLQYQRAIRLYYRRFQRYPTSIDQLENTNQIRFLRKRYTDPFTGKDDWRLIHFGEAKVPQMGFFGQPLGGVGTPAAALASTQSPSSITAATNPSSSTTPTFGASSGTGSSSSSAGTPSTVGPIVGVSSTSDKESIRTYRKQAHYNQWEFVYDPIQEQAMSAALGSPTTGTNTPTPPGTAAPGSPGVPPTSQTPAPDPGNVNNPPPPTP